MNKPVEISQESTVNRVLRENALAALMVVLTVIGLANGLLIGLGIAVGLMQADKMEKLEGMYYEHSIYTKNLHADLEARGFEPPPLPDPNQEKE